MHMNGATVYFPPSFHKCTEFRIVPFTWAPDPSKLLVVAIHTLIFLKRRISLHPHPIHTQNKIIRTPWWPFSSQQHAVVLPQACWHVVICHVNAAPAICYNSDSTWVQVRINYARVKGGMCSSLLCPSTLSPSHHLRPTSRCTLSQRVPCSSSSDTQLSTVMPSWRHWTRRD